MVEDKRQYVYTDSANIVTIGIGVNVGVGIWREVILMCNFLGGVWANESWGRYWGWDPKETWSLICIVVYAIALHLRFIAKLNTPYIFAVFSVVAFYSVLMTYFGVNFYLSGKHSYATGEGASIPLFVYIMLGVCVALIFGAFWKRKLQPPQI